jgi:hypothetical protein
MYQGLISIMPKSTISYLLDDFPAEVGFSLRKLTSSTTRVIRVRRSGGGAESDFNESDILDGTMTAWVVAGGGAQDGTVAKWYNQGTGGATNDAVQTSAGSQFKIVSGGTLITTNVLPSIDTLTQIPMPFGAQTFKTFFSVAKVDTQNLLNFVTGSDISGAGIIYNGTYGGVDGLAPYDGTNLPSLTGEDLNQHLAYFNMRSSKVYGAKDGAAETDLGTFATSISNELIGGRSFSSAAYFQGKIQEIVLYNSDQNANKTAIETNINDYYGIY